MDTGSTGKNESKSKCEAQPVKIKLLGWWLSDPRPLRTASALVLISSFTENRVLASWYSHFVQWGGKNGQFGRTNKTKKK